jgi:hypothetical protein
VEHINIDEANFQQRIEDLIREKTEENSASYGVEKK